MKSRLRTAMAGLATAVVVLASSATAFAAAPSFEPDTQTNGACQPNASSFCTIRFYDANGIPVTHGLTTDAPFATYVMADQLDLRTTDNRAALRMATPVAGAATATFPNAPLTANVAYPDPTAPSPMNNTGTAGSGTGLPMVKVVAANTTLASYISAHPNTSATDPNVYQIRLFTASAATPAGTNYYSADILVNPSTNAWSLVYPGAQSTTTTVTTQETSPQTSPVTLHVTATVSAINAVGSVQFFADGAAQGPLVSTTAGVAGTTMSAPPLNNSTHQLTAQFFPTDPVAFSGSTSPAVPFTIQGPAAQPTTTGLTVNTGTSQANSPVTFTATVSPTAAVGTVTFSETPTGTVIGTAPSGSGTFTLVSSSLGQGGHSVIATFNPSNNFTTSQSPVVNFVLGAPACGTCTDVQNVTVSVPAGTLAISTPYHAANPLNMGTLVLNSSATQYSVTATFGGAGTAGISISDTRAGQPLPWTASVLASSLTQGGSSISGENVGLTNLVARAGQSVSAAAGNLTTFNNPAANPAVAPNDPGSLGLGGTTPHEAIHATNGGGNITYDGVLTINAPTTTPSGTYNGTITFTIG